MEAGGSFLGEPEGATSTDPPTLRGILGVYERRVCFIPERTFTGPLEAGFALSTMRPEKWPEALHQSASSGQQFLCCSADGGLAWAHVKRWKRVLRLRETSLSGKPRMLCTHSVKAKWFGYKGGTWGVSVINTAIVAFEGGLGSYHTSHI